MSVPVRGFEEDGENSGTAKLGVHGAALEEAIEGVGAGLGKGWAETVAPDIFHFVLVWEWRYGTLWILFA